MTILTWYLQLFHAINALVDTIDTLHTDLVDFNAQNTNWHKSDVACLDVDLKMAVWKWGEYGTGSPRHGSVVSRGCYMARHYQVISTTRALTLFSCVPAPYPWFPLKSRLEAEDCRTICYAHIWSCGFVGTRTTHDVHIWACPYKAGRLYQWNVQGQFLI